MKQTALEFYAEQEVKLTLDFLANKINQVEYGIKRVKLIEQAKEMEAKQRQEDTNHGYSQGYDDGAQGKEPMQPEISDLEGQSCQDKMRDKITKVKSRLK
jgi:hypothetical protein